MTEAPIAQGAQAQDDQEHHFWVVFTNAEEGQDAELNDWYEQHHVREILGVDGFVWGQRLQLHPDQRPGQAAPPWKYLALYETVGDLPTVHADLKKASPGFVKTPALAKDSVAWVFSYLGSRVPKPTD